MTSRRKPSLGKKILLGVFALVPPWFYLPSLIAMVSEGRGEGGAELQLGSTASPVRTFMLRGLAGLHQPAHVLPVPRVTSVDHVGEIGHGKSKIFPFWGMMEKQPRSRCVYSRMFASTRRMRPMVSLKSWLPAQLQRPGLRQVTRMCVPALRPQKKGVIINSQGCEVPEQEKSNIFEQHLHAAEPTSVMPERAAGSCHARAYQGGTH